MKHHHDKGSVDEFVLADLRGMRRDDWRLIAVTTVAFTLAGAAYALLAPERFTATASLQMAQVAGVAVEAPAVLVEKLRLPLYYSEKALEGCKVESDQDAFERLARDLTPTLVKAAEMVTLSYTADSPGAAKECLEAVLWEIGARQAEIAKPIIDSKSSMLAALQGKLKNAEAIRAQLSERSLKFDFNDQKFSAASLLFNTIIAKESEIKDLTNQVNDLRILLTPPVTKATSLAVPIYSPQKRSSPKRGLVIALSLVAGGTLGLVLAVSRQMASRLRRQGATGAVGPAPG